MHDPDIVTRDCAESGAPVTPRDQILDLVARYNNCADRGRVDEFLEVFTADAVLELTHQRLEGKADIDTTIRAIATGARPDVDLRGARHHLTTSRIEILDRDNARGWIYFFVSRRGVILEEGTYIDRYRRIDAGWHIAHRRVKMHYTVHNADI